MTAPITADTCRSYNGGFGKKPEVILKHLVGISPDGGKTYRDVAIDACIAPVVQHLWDNGVSTVGSCCGHGEQAASIILADGVENYSQIREWIAEKDQRHFELSQWKRVLV